jgi:hypothetical protein
MVFLRYVTEGKRSAARSVLLLAYLERELKDLDAVLARLLATDPPLLNVDVGPYDGSGRATIFGCRRR